MLQNDLAKRLCPAERVVCLVVDECHRAVGDASPVVAIRALTAAAGASLRIIGLSATPGSDADKIQEVISNVRASRVVFFGEEDPEVKRYRHGRTCDTIVVRATGAVLRCEAALREVQVELLSRLTEAGLLDRMNGDVSAFTILKQFQTRKANGTRCGPSLLSRSGWWLTKICSCVPREMLICSCVLDVCDCGCGGCLHGCVHLHRGLGMCA